MFSIQLSALPLLAATHQAAQRANETSDFPYWLTIALVLTLIALIGWGIYDFYKGGKIVVGELEVGTVFTKNEGDFVKFLPAKSGTHWLNPKKFRAGDKIFLGSQTASDTCEELRTKEGLPLSIDYNVSFSVNPFDCLETIKHKMARALPNNAPNMVNARVRHVLRHLVEQKSIEELYQDDAIKKLEEEVRATVHARSTAIGLQPISANDMKLGPIRMPPQVEKALKANYERKLQTATSIEALERLQTAINKFSQQDMERLAELERLRILESSGPSVYMMDSLKQVRDVAHTNGSN